MAKFGKDIIVRTLSGAVLLLVVLGAILLSEYTFAALMAVICAGAMWEFFRIAVKDGLKPHSLYAIIVGGVSVALNFLVASGVVSPRYLLALIPLVAAVFAAELYRKDNTRHLANISVSVTGLVYAALPMSLISHIGYLSGAYSPYIVLACIFTVWVNDIFAYLTGIMFGKHRLFERISPKKSWEGFFGGLVFSIAFAALCGYLLNANVVVWAGLGVVIVVSGVFGDLVESMFKREAGIKDSGSIIPGHGGFLDRFDALLYSIPFVYVYFAILAPLM